MKSIISMRDQILNKICQTKKTTKINKRNKKISNKNLIFDGLI